MTVIPFRTRSRRDAAYAHAELDKLIHDLGDIAGIYDRAQTLVRELRADGFDLAAKNAARALPHLREAELVLEQAKARVRA